MEKTEQLNIRLTESELDTLKHNAANNHVSVSAYVVSKACQCGERGYEGIYSAITWKCCKCGKVNHWRAK